MKATAAIEPSADARRHEERNAGQATDRAQPEHGARNPPGEDPAVATLLALARSFLPGPNTGVAPLTAAASDSSEPAPLGAPGHQAEWRYQKLIEQIPVVSFIVSLHNQKHEIYVSPHIERILGYTAQEWAEDPVLWYQRLYAEDRERWNQEFCRTIARAEPFKGDYRFLAKDGHLVWIHGEVTVTRDEANRPALLLGIGYDITELKAAQERQAQLLAELGAINQQLNDFAYVISHDVKAPLRAISSLAQWLSDDYGDQLGAKGQEQIRLLLDRTRRLNALVGGILRYSRTARHQEEAVVVDVNRLVREVCDLLAPPPGIVLQVAPNLPILRCERTRLAQVFENLIGNAIKHMDKPAGQVSVGCENAGTQWKFHVRDNGPGIEEKDHEKIFELFHTLAPSSDQESTGIGLAIVKKNLEQLGGKIWVESKAGQGSSFYFLLPRTSAARAEANGFPAPKPRAQDPRRTPHP